MDVVERAGETHSDCPLGLRARCLGALSKGAEWRWEQGPDAGL